MKFLFTVWPYSGHVHPCLAVARALRARDHEVAFYTGAAMRGVVEGAGFECFPFRGLAQRVAELVGCQDGSDHPELYASLTNRYTSIDEKSPFEKWRRMQALYGEMVVGTTVAQVADQSALLAQWQPDVVVTDAFMWGPVLILREIQDVPVTVLSFFAGCMIPGPGAPPPGFGLPKPTNWRKRAVVQMVSAISARATAKIRRQANEVRRQHGLPPFPGTYFELTGRVPLHLVASSPEYDYERQDLPPSVHYAGACSYDQPCEESLTGRLNSTPPVVYVSEGTCQVRQPVVLRAAAKALGGQPLQVVMTTGKQRASQTLDLGPPAENIMVESWVSLGRLLPRCSVVVTNGGSGTVRAALQAGVPLVVVPMEWDQLENAQRVVEAGAGLRISPRRCNARRVRAAVETLLGDPSFARNARRIADSFSRYGQGEEAARLLESLGPRHHAVSAQATTEGGQ